MTLNHINLVVTNLAAAVDLFEKHFGFTCTEVKGDNILAILKNEDDFTLVIMTSKDGDFKFPSAFHIGFMQTTAEEVTAIYENLKNSGMDVGNEPKKNQEQLWILFPV